MKPDEIVIRNLQFLLRTYDDEKKTLAKAKQRLKAMIPEAEEKHQEHIKAFESEKGKLSREIEKTLEYWDVWTSWAKHVPGIGPFIAGNLIILFYYRFIAVCQKCGADLLKKEAKKNGDDEDENGNAGGFYCSICGKTAKGDGIIKTRIEEKDFPNVSKWWAYLGEHNDAETGRMVRRKKGKQSNWSSLGRNISWQIGESINKCPACIHCGKSSPKSKKNPCKCGRYKPEHLYNAHYWSFIQKKKKHFDAIRRTRKLFLSHFWHVGRELEGKSTVGPYADVVLQHTGIIAPYYFESKKEEKKAA